MTRSLSLSGGADEKDQNTRGVEPVEPEGPVELGVGEAARRAGAEAQSVRSEGEVFADVPRVEQREPVGAAAVLRLQPAEARREDERRRRPGELTLEQDAGRQPR